MSTEASVSVSLGSPLPVLHSKIARWELQPRKEFLENDLLELAASIEQDGQQQPIIITKDANKPGYFILIDGERRWRAFGIIGMRTGKDPIVNCYVDIISDTKTHFRKSVIANLHRRDLSAVEEAASLFKLHNEFEESIISLARMTGKSVSYIDNYIKLHTLPDKVKDLMRLSIPKNQRLATTQAIDIVRSTKDPRLQIEFAQEAISRNLSVEDTRLLIAHKVGNSFITNGLDPQEREYVAFRQPANKQYLKIASALGMIKTKARTLLNMDMETIYFARNDEVADREKDAACIRKAISELKALLEKVEIKR